MAVKNILQLPSDEELRRAHPPIWVWYDHCCPNSQHPVGCRLLLAYVRRLSRLYAPPAWKSPRYPNEALQLLEFLKQEQVPRPYWLAHPDEFQRIYVELRDLLRRLGKMPFRFEDETLLRHTRQALEKQGLLLEEIDELLLKAARRHRGAPSTKRGIAVAALESKLLHPEYKLKDLVDLHCSCKKKSLAMTNIVLKVCAWQLLN